MARAETASDRPTSTRRRRDVEMLRALAVVLVLVHHIGTGRVSGGVDVFFLLSGLLVTLSFLHRVDRPDQVEAPVWSLRATLVARFTRLLPLMSLVLVVVLAAALALVPPLRWHGMLRQALASVTFTQNQLLADLSVDYYANNRALAPALQHLWSMAITGQFYLVWALVCAGLWWLARRIHRAHVTAWVAMAGIVTVGGSFALSIVQTAQDPVRAYFLTLPRMWEFGVGILLAVLLHRWGPRMSDWATAVGAGPRDRVRRGLLPVLGWLGVVALVTCGFLQPADAWFPGWIALWPIGGAVLVVLGGDTRRWGMAAALDNPVSRWVSAHSYGLFLWHWPVLVLWQQHFERSWATAVDGVAIVLITVVLTWAGDQVVELGLERTKRRRLLVLAMAVVVVVVPVTVWTSVLTRGSEQVAAQPQESNPGARVLRPDVAEPDPNARLMPYDADVEDEWAGLPGRCDLPEDTDPWVANNCGEYRPDGEPTRTVVVVGDSRSQQWTAALEPIAVSQGWHLMGITMHQCAYRTAMEGISEVCNDFNTAVQQWVLDVEPDAVVAVATRSSADDTPEHLEVGFLEGAEPLLEAGIEVVAMRDTPRFAFDVPECVQRHGADSPRCQVPRDQALAPDSPLLELPPHPGLATIDMTNWVCTDGVCRPVIGNVYVYMDVQHLSKTYAATLSDELAEQWFAATGWDGSA